MLKARLTLLAIALLVAVPLTAQDATPVPAAMDMTAVLVDGLNAPRHVFVDGESVYVVEAGQGGETAVETAFGKGMFGNSGEVSLIGEDGTATPFISGLFSILTESGEVTGPHAFYKTDEAAWVLVGQGVAETPAETPAWSLLQYSADGTTLESTLDLLPFEETENPDGGEIDSNPVDFLVADDGTVYVADAGANAVLKIVDGEISTFAAWPPVAEQPQAVPTSLEMDAEGNLYVGFLTGFPFPVGGAWVEKFDATGASLERYDGLTMVVDLDMAADGTLYAVQFGEFGEQGPVPASGQIVRVSAEGSEPVVTGLTFPYGMAVREDGSFLVANSASFLPAGQLLHLNAGDVAPMPAMPPMPGGEATEMPAPATTEEAQ